MTQFYLLPIDSITVGRTVNRGPKYLKWILRDGIDSYWSLKDFGNHVPLAIVSSSKKVHGRDIFEFPENLDKSINPKHAEQLYGTLRDAGVDMRWASNSDSYRELLHRTLGVAFSMQAGRDQPDIWLEKPIFFGRVWIDPFRRSSIRETVLKFGWMNGFRGFFTPEGRFFPSLIGGALPATDNFTSASDQSLTAYSANWTMNGGAFIVNGATDDVGGNNFNAESAAHWNADTFANDHYAQVVMNTVSQSGGRMGPACRVASGATVTYYAHYGDNSAATMFKMVTSTKTQLGSNGAKFIAGETRYIEASGTNITPKTNGSVGDIGTQTDSAIASGSGGLAGFSDLGGILADNWQADNLSGGGGGSSGGVLSIALERDYMRGNMRGVMRGSV